MRSSNSTSRRHQTAPDYLHGIWLLKKGVAWGRGWQCGARFGLRKILVSANTPLPSRKSLQKTSNIVMAKVEMLNMSHRCRQVVDINHLRGSYLHTPSLYSLLACTIIHCTQELARRSSSRRHKLCTPLLRMSPRSGRSLKC